MKKLFTLFLALVASIGTIFASDTQIDGIWYNFDDSNNTASVTYRGYDYYDYDNEYSGSVAIPATVLYNNKTYSVTSISHDAFRDCSELTSVTISYGVTSIGYYAFMDCVTLNSITFPNSITTIEYGVFSGCGSLSVPIYNEHIFAYLPRNYAGTYTIPNGVETIAREACSGCRSLIAIEIPSGVTSIGDEAFSRCSGLTSVTIPNSVTSIESRAFQSCSSLTNVETPAILFNDALNTFYTYQAEMPSHIKHITINGGELNADGLDHIRVSYRELETIDLSMAENTDLLDVALNGCYKLQTLILPNNLERIGYMAVADCKNLQSINIPASVTEINQSAFENCRSLSDVQFAAGSQLQTIGNWAFYNCHAMQNLEIPEGVTFIGDGAFYGCTYLEDLTLPASVQSIGDNTFALCAKLKKMVVNAPVPPSIQTKTFFEVNRQTPVYVPDNSVNTYLNDPLWSEFNIQGISNLPSALDHITNDQLPTTNKVFRNGQIFILRGDKTYTVTGQEAK